MLSNTYGWNVISLDTVDSTNLEARRMARDTGERRKTLITALEQTAGRGRLMRKWESPKGAGLWMTQLFAPKGIAAKDAGGAVFLSAAALCSVLRGITGAEVLIKWPNDLVLNGKKICGMLAECGLAGDACDYLILGTGLNLAKGALPPELTYASSIEELTGMLPDREYILNKYLPAFEELLTTWEEHGLAPIIERIRPMSATLGREVRVNGEHAVALDMGAAGELIIRSDDGCVRSVIAGDVSVRGITDYV